MRGGFYLMTSIFACCILFVFPSPSPVSYVWLLSVLYIGPLPAFRSVFVGSASSKLNWDPKQVCTCVSHATPSWRSHLTLSVRLVYTLPYLQWRIGMLLIFLTSRMVLSAMSCPHGNNVTSVVGWLIYLFFLLPTTLAGKSEGFLVNREVCWKRNTWAVSQHKRGWRVFLKISNQNWISNRRVCVCHFDTIMGSIINQCNRLLNYFGDFTWILHLKSNYLDRILFQTCKNNWNNKRKKT